LSQFVWNYQSLQLPTYHLPTSIKVTFSGAPITAPAAESIKQLTAGEDQIHRLRDGELILYRRSDSRIWQYKFKRESGSWYRASTRKSVLEQAKRVAMDLHDEARYRERLGLAPAHKSFKDIALATVEEMQRDLAAGTGKKIYVDYCSVIERYFIPYFGDKYLQNLKHKDIADFEAWRNHRMARTPKSSTLMTFASAFSRVHQTAISRGWISDRVPIPTMSRRGAKGEVRPAFSVEEIGKLRQFMTSWQTQGNLDYDRIMRPLLCAYVEFLLLTGMRHGTESMGIEWRHCEWYASEGQRYIRVWVDGKTGGRWLIAKHEAEAVLIKLHSLQPDIADKPIELVMGRDTKYLFRRPDGQRPRTFNGMFSKLMRESGLRWNHTNQSRTLYSLRHSYATMELLAETDIHTLARQMGTSVRMLEAHYSKLTATMAADKLA
jgi:integrase